MQWPKNNYKAARWGLKFVYHKPESEGSYGPSHLFRFDYKPKQWTYSVGLAVTNTNHHKIGIEKGLYFKPYEIWLFADRT